MTRSDFMLYIGSGFTFTKVAEVRVVFPLPEMVFLLLEMTFPLPEMVFLLKEMTFPLPEMVFPLKEMTFHC